MTRANPAKRYTPQRLRATKNSRPVLDAPCAFCRGTGRDPFGVISSLATCQVCGGVGRHSLRQPVTICAFCQGKGIHPSSRLTCTTCGGVGMVEIPLNAATCSCCKGTGRAADHLWPGSPVSCSCCRGTGVVAADVAGE